MKSYIKKSRQSNGSNLLHLYALCIKMSKKGSLRDFKGGIVPDKLLFSETDDLSGFWSKKRKYLVSNSCLGENALLGAGLALWLCRCPYAIWL